ncbi:DUF4870 domain-containing protein [Isoptericola chiayiensis]|uniref:DUF4870 domain-containing protein n=1 Tax=Isoptericola chiayiensis TaxID=579446 RepID=A0ABP8YJF0_9MICO|nr:DUF4870 domain-containing protein [Isoptericola chiayiensis]NOW00351.1 hypothetical protein [Isoptericola chiayiensis]
MTQTPPPPGAGGFEGPRPLSRSDERTWAIFAHLGPLLVGVLTVGWLAFVAPLVIWLVLRDRSTYVANQAKEALNFQLTLLIGTVIGYLLTWILVGFLILGVVWVFGIVFAIIAALAVNRYEDFEYPLTLRLVK